MEEPDVQSNFITYQVLAYALTINGHILKLSLTENLSFLPMSTSKKNIFCVTLSIAIILFLAGPSRAQLINAKQRASSHAITARKPAVEFFDGALLGNGGMGVVVNTRPDAIEFHFGHNNVWDIRIAEKNKDKIGTFEQVFERVNGIRSNYKSISEDSSFKK